MDFSVLDTTANITTIRLFEYKNDFFEKIVQRWEIMEFDLDPKRSRKHLEPKSIKVSAVWGKILS